MDTYAFMVRNVSSRRIGDRVLHIFDYRYFYRYSQMKEKIREKQIDEFIEIFSYFRIYVSNNENVYTALKNILQFASYNTKERLQTLINEIDEDKSLAPFVKFSDYYKKQIRRKRPFFHNLFHPKNNNS